MRSHARIVAVVTLVAFSASLCAPVPAQAVSLAEAGQWLREFPGRFVRRIIPPKKKIENPRELDEVFSEAKVPTYNENPVQRDEKSDVTRPLKQVGLGVLDGQIGIVRQFLSYQAAEYVKTVGKGVAATAAWGTARQVVSRMGEPVARRLDSSLCRGAFGQGLFAHLGRAGQGAFRKALLREGNFALMTLIGVLITSGVYDGLDVDTMKDRVIAAEPVACSWSYDKEVPAAIVQGYLSRQLYAGFNGAFDRLYQRALSSRSVWGQALAGLDHKAASLGQAYFKTAAAKHGGASLAEKMGLVGVGEGVPFTLQGLAGRLAVGSAFAVAGQFAIDAAGVMVRGVPDRVMLGGNRDRYYAQQDFNSYQFQRTGKPGKDWWEPRRILLRDLVHGRVKWPVKSLAVPVTSMLGGYVGSVVTGLLFAAGGPATLVGGTLVSCLFAGVGSFVGNWLATKADRSQFMMTLRRKGYVKRIEAEIRQMPAYRAGQIDDAMARAIAVARAADFEKLEIVGQVGTRILIVDDFRNVRLERRGDYLEMVIPDENGSRLREHADVRYDILDLAGNRLVFDLHTGAMRNVGKVAENSGRPIVFVSAEGASVEGDVLGNRDGGSLHVYDNGIILEKRDDEWVARGQGSARDIFLRETGERFAWDGSRFRRARGPGDVSLPATLTDPAGEPLAAFEAVVDKSEDDALLGRVVSHSSTVIAAVRESLFARLDRCADASALQAVLDEASRRLGTALPDEPLRGPGADTDALRDRVKGLVERFIQRCGRQIGRALQECDGAALRRAFHEVRSSCPLTPDVKRIEVHDARLSASGVWGRLSLLADPDALLAFSLEPARADDEVAAAAEDE